MADTTHCTASSSSPLRQTAHHEASSSPYFDADEFAMRQSTPSDSSLLGSNSDGGAGTSPSNTREDAGGPDRAKSAIQETNIDKNPTARVGKTFPLLGDSDSYMTLGGESTASVASTAQGFGRAHNNVLKVALGRRNSAIASTSPSSTLNSTPRRASVAVVQTNDNASGHPLSPGQGGASGPANTPHTFMTSPRDAHPTVQELGRDDETEGSRSTQGQVTPRRGRSGAGFNSESPRNSPGSQSRAMQNSASGSAYTSPSAHETGSSGNTTPTSQAGGSGAHNRGGFSANVHTTPIATHDTEISTRTPSAPSLAPAVAASPESHGFEQFDPPTRDDSPRSADRKRAVFLMALSAMKLKSGAIAEPKTPSLGQASKSFHYRVGTDYSAESGHGQQTQPKPLKRPHSARAAASQPWPGTTERKAADAEGGSNSPPQHPGAGAARRPASVRAHQAPPSGPVPPPPGHVPAYLRRWKQQQLAEKAASSSADSLGSEEVPGNVRPRVDAKWEMDTLPHNDDRGDALRKWVATKSERDREQRRLQEVQRRIDANARDGWQESMRTAERADGTEPPGGTTAAGTNHYGQKNRRRSTVQRPWHLRGVLPSSADRLVQALMREEKAEQAKAEQRRRRNQAAGQLPPTSQHAARRHSPLAPADGKAHRASPEQAPPPAATPAAATWVAQMPSPALIQQLQLSPAGAPAGTLPHIAAQSLMPNPYLDPQRCRMQPAELPQQPHRPSRLLPKGRQAAETKLWWLQMQQHSQDVHQALAGNTTRQGSDVFPPPGGSPPLPSATRGSRPQRKKRPGRKLKRKPKAST